MVFCILISLSKIKTLVQKQYILIFLLGSILLSACSGQGRFSSPPVVKEGLLDLRSWNFKRDGIISLDGEWAFYWKCFLFHKEQASISSNSVKPTWVKVPASWNRVKLDNQFLPSHGYASYQLDVLFAKDNKELTLDVPSMGTSYELYMNGQLIGKVGEIGTSSTTQTPFTLPRTYTFIPQKDTVRIVFQIANYHHKYGGLGHQVKLGQSTQIQVKRDRHIALSLVLAGCFFIMAIYNLGIFLLRRQDAPALYFSLVCVLFGVHTLITHEKYLLHLFPFIPWEIINKLEYLTIYLGLPIYLKFFYSLYPREFARSILNIIGAVFFSLSIFVIFTPVVIFSQSNPYVPFGMIITGLYLLYVLILATLRKRPLSKRFTLGYLIFLISVIHDLLYTFQVLDTGYYASYGLLAFIFTQSFILSLRYAGAFSRVEELSASLERRVHERTAEIIHQNKALRRQKNEILHQSELLTKKNEDVTASINYASRIQKAILGSQDAITSNFKDSFIYWEPRDIVSGDFYWYTEVKRAGSTKKNLERQTVFFKVIVAADCTGHGIPGAFMTVMGSALLDEIINENRVTNPGRVLSVLDRKLLMKLQRHGVQDGMDLAILFFDNENKTVSFAGANNPLYYVRDGEMYQVKGSRFPIGSSQYQNRKRFETHTFQYEKGDAFYIFSDGFQDQFGGPEGRKYYKKHFREFILKVSHLPMDEQKKRIQKEFMDWKGETFQTDDILIIGVRT